MFEYIANNHKSLDGFQYGDKYEANNRATDTCARLYLQFPIIINYTETGSKSFAFTMMILSKHGRQNPTVSTDRTEEILKYQEISKCEKIAESIFFQLNELAGFPIDWKIENNITAVTMENVFNDDLVGVALDLRISGRQDWNGCTDLFDDGFILKNFC
jgi:hypothetical protein